MSGADAAHSLSIALGRIRDQRPDPVVVHAGLQRAAPDRASALLSEDASLHHAAKWRRLKEAFGMINI